MAYFTENPPLCQALLLVIIEINQLNSIAIDGFFIAVHPGCSCLSCRGKFENQSSVFI
jgi:hypothetical protein